jgi:hypothetical protein
VRESEGEGEGEGGRRERERRNRYPVGSEGKRDRAIIEGEERERDQQDSDKLHGFAMHSTARKQLATVPKAWIRL